jgi:hypothetical protein
VHEGRVGRLLVPVWSSVDGVAIGIASGAAVLLLWRKWPMLLVLALGVVSGVTAFGVRWLLA